MKILVFPSVVDGAREFAALAHSFGCDVIGSASVPDPLNDSAFDDWHPLPFITSPNFWNALQDVCRLRDIDLIYTPHNTTRIFLEVNHDKLPPDVELFGKGPIRDQTDRVRAAWKDIATKMVRIEFYALGNQPYMSEYVASLLDRFHQIPGECQEEKVLAFCGIFDDAPRGDVVEIGSLFGKSAYVLNQLAVERDVGETICVDAWDVKAAVQHDLSHEIQHLSLSWDNDTLISGFLLTMGTAHNFKYIQRMSDEAIGIYAPAWKKTKPVISVLHIDGNHDEAQVRRDWRNWGPLIGERGWVVFDDYIWSHGDGPHKVGDEAAAELGHRVKRKFVAGGALFMQIASG